MLVGIFICMVARETLHHLVELIRLVRCTTQLLAQEASASLSANHTNDGVGSFMRENVVSSSFPACQQDVIVCCMLSKPGSSLNGLCIGNVTYFVQLTLTFDGSWTPEGRQ